MYHFLGIVLEEDILNGTIIPAYILCQSKGTSENRSGWRVIRQSEDNSMANMPKVLTKTLIGNDNMIDFLCNYRTRDHMHGDKNYKAEDTKKYYPKGALFWFECDKNGKPLDNAIFITRVPRKTGISDGGFKRLIEQNSYVPPIKTVLAREPTMKENEFSVVKPKLAQVWVKRKRSKKK